MHLSHRFVLNRAARISAGVLLSFGLSTMSLAGVECTCAGDITLDGNVDGADIAIVLGNWGTANQIADLDLSGNVDGADIAIVLGNWGACTAPANDDCDDALLIGPGAHAFCTQYATTDGPPLPGLACSPAQDVHNDIWYRFEPLSDGTLTLTTCDAASFDTVLAVYGSLLDGLSPCPVDGPSFATFIECDDDDQACETYTSTITLDVVAGKIYKIRLGGYLATSKGVGTLTVEFESEGSACTNPINATFSTFQVFEGNTSDNPVDASVPSNCFAPQPKGPMEWISYTATCTGILTLSTCNPGTDYDTIISVLRYEFDGQCWSAFIECNDDWDLDPDCALPSGFQHKSYLQVPTSPGEVFKIVVAGWNGKSGNYELTLDQNCN